MKLSWAFTLAYALSVHASSWRAYYGLSAEAYQAKFDEMVEKGYRLNSVDGYEKNNAPAFAVIFEKRPSTAWWSHSGMTSEQYQEKFDKYLDQGYHVSQVNGYTINGKDYYAAIWDKSPVGAWAARHGMSTGWMQKYFDDYLEKGYRMTHISGYEAGDEPRYAALWEKTDDKTAWMSRGNLTSSEYQATFDEHVQKGYRVVDVSGYQVNGEVYYTAIFDKSPSGPWVARHGIDSPTFQAEFDKYKSQGYVLRTFSAYNDGDEPRFAGIWVKPT